MKKVKKRKIFCLLLIITISACVKNMGSIRYINDKPNNILNLSKPIVKRREPLLVTVNNPGNNTIIRWTIDPPANTSFSLVNGQDTQYCNIFSNFSKRLPDYMASYYNLMDTTKRL